MESLEIKLVVWAETERGGERGLDSGQTPHIIQDRSGRGAVGETDGKKVFLFC